MKDTKIDIGPDCFEWQTRNRLAKLLDVSPGTISTSLNQGKRVAGYEVEYRPLDDALRAELNIDDGRITCVYRVAREEHASDIANAKAKASVEEPSERRELAKLRSEKTSLVEKVKSLQARIAQFEKMSDAEQVLRKRIAQLEGTVEQLEADLETARQVETSDSPDPVLIDALLSALGDTSEGDMREILSAALRKVVG